MPDLCDRGGPLRIETDFRIGILGHHMNCRRTVRGGFGVAVTQSGRLNEAVFLAESDVPGTWQLCQSVAFRAGYLLMWIDGVGLSDGTFAAGPNADSTRFVHGGTLGIECVF